MAAIVQLPVYNPITNPDKNEIRKNDVLRKMLELGKCTQEDMTLPWLMMYILELNLLMKSIHQLHIIVTLQMKL